MSRYNIAIREKGGGQRGTLIKALGKEVKTIRGTKELTQERVAELAGINSKYLGEIERDS